MESCDPCDEYQLEGKGFGCFCCMFLGLSKKGGEKRRKNAQVNMKILVLDIMLYNTLTQYSYLYW